MPLQKRDLCNLVWRKKKHIYRYRYQWSAKCVIKYRQRMSAKNPILCIPIKNSCNPADDVIWNPFCRSCLHAQYWAALHSCSDVCDHTSSCTEIYLYFSPDFDGQLTFSLKGAFHRVLPFVSGWASNHGRVHTGCYSQQLQHRTGKREWINVCFCQT